MPGVADDPIFVNRRTEARERCEQAGVLMSGARQLTQLERALAT